GSFSVSSRRSVSFSSGLVRSMRSPLVFATRAASARRGLIDLAMSNAVVPLGTSLVDPSGSLILITATSAEVWTVSDIIEPMYSAELFKFIGRAREGQTGGGHHVGPDALVRAGERSSPISGASLRRHFDCVLSISRHSAELRSAGRVRAPAPTWTPRARPYVGVVDARIISACAPRSTALPSPGTRRPGRPRPGGRAELANLRSIPPPGISSVLSISRHSADRSAGRVRAPAPTWAPRARPYVGVLDARIISACAPRSTALPSPCTRRPGRPRPGGRAELAILRSIPPPAFRLRVVDLPPTCGASLRRAGEGTRPYVGSAGPPLRGYR